MLEGRISCELEVIMIMQRYERNEKQIVILQDVILMFQHCIDY